MFGYTDTRGAVEVAFTDRHGGTSTPPYDSLNLAVPKEPPDDLDLATLSEQAERNIARVHDAFTGGGGGVLVRMRQVHGADVATVDERLAAPDADVPVADGLVTAMAGVTLLVRVADCVPVLLGDPVAGVVGAAHAGRPGLVAGVVPATVARMRDLGAQDITAWIGPHVCGRCYEVPAAMRDEVSSVVPASFAETSWGTPALDVGAGVRSQLEADGVTVLEEPACTIEVDDLYSYRRQGALSGRLGGLVRIRP